MPDRVAFGRIPGMTESDFTAYSQLETFLLFQYLAQLGVEAPAFARISEKLKSNPAIVGANGYDAGRLSPDSLRDLYLQLLKEEVKSELQHASDSDGAGTNGDGTSRNGKKRKARSPSLPTVQDVAKKKDLLPGLIVKLYTRYRETVVRQIREEERTYDQLKSDIDEIEKGDWDERLRTKDDRVANDEPHRAVVQMNGDSRSPQTSSSNTAGAKDVKSGSAAINGGPSPYRQPLGIDSTRPPVSPRTAAKIDALINQPGESTTASRPSANQLNHSPTQQSHLHPKSPVQSSQAYKPLPHSPGSKHPHSSPQQSTSYPPNSHTNPPSAAAGQRQNQHGSPQVPNPTSPVILPPPPGMLHTPSTVSNHQSSRGTQGASTQPPFSQPVSAANQYQANGTSNTKTPSTPYAHPGYHPPPPAQGGLMLQPFQVNPQDPIKAHQASQQIASPAPSTPLPANTHQIPPDMASIMKSLESYQKKSTPRTRPPLRIETKWKPFTERGTTPIFSPTPSPIHDEARLASPPLETISRGFGELEKSRTRRTRKSEAAAASAPSPAPSTTSSRSVRGGKKRQVSSRRVRGASVTSTAPSAVASSMRGRTRSPSVTSQAEVGTTEDSTSAIARKVKNEPATPADTTETPSAMETTPSTALPGSRRRRGTVSSVTGGTNVPARTSKRKRTATPDSRIERAISKPSHITAARNFPKMSQPIINDISSHKHASLFSNRVRDRDAEGYSSIIKRPTDLKTIRTAIVAGSRAVASAAAEMTPTAGAPASSPANGNAPGLTVVLPLREDLVPPNGIVNSAQLERELMRMFANAVMFNPGDDGVVRDSREMFDAVCGSVGNWRDAERVAEENALESRDEGVSKRRKLE